MTVILKGKVIKTDYCHGGASVVSLRKVFKYDFKMKFTVRKEQFLKFQEEKEG